MAKSTEYPHNKKQAAAQVAKLKKANAAKNKAKGYPKLTAAQERQIRSETAFVGKSASSTATKKAKKKAAPKTGAAKNMTDAQLAAIGRDYMKKTKPKAKAKPKVKNLPGKKGAKKTYKPY